MATVYDGFMRGMERACGDAWSAVESDGCLSVLVADGLGHGPLAAQASLSAVDVLEQRPSSLPADMMHDIHAALHHTRGAAVAVARIDFHRSSGYRCFPR